MIRAVVFDIGQTLTYYPIPLNWSGMYRQAFGSVAETLGFTISEEEYAHIGETLAKYNARIHPREVEVPADVIFSEILQGTRIDKNLLQDVKREFFSFFRSDVCVYPEAERTLAELKERGLPIATLSDVPYGMDNVYALEDIRPLLKYVDLPYTSNDIGFRKPSGKGLLRIAQELELRPEELAFVGDEAKDMECARNAGALGILVNRTDEKKEFGQDLEIRDLAELLHCVSGDGSV
ncbi:MAG: HAD family hydrolase [Lachnospiraceae bacterium]|nr:HAD family hydrolase [Lachnospiraceae bacterium]